MTSLALEPPVHIMRAQGFTCAYAVALLREFAVQQQEPCSLTEDDFQRLGRSGNVITFLALHDHNWAGVLCVQKIIDVFSATLFLKVEALYVAPDFRSKGVGRALMKKLDEFAVDCGARELEWEAWERDLETVALYDKIATRVLGAVVFRQSVSEPFGPRL